LLGGLFFGGSRPRGLVFGNGGHDLIVVFKCWWAKRLAEVWAGLVQQAHQGRRQTSDFIRKSSLGLGIYLMFYGWRLAGCPDAKKCRGIERKLGQIRVAGK
jgi:hypothetical protein